MPDTKVQLIYKEVGKGFIKKIRKNCKVLGSYDFHILLLDLETQLKISVTKTDLLNGNTAIALYPSENS